MIQPLQNETFLSNQTFLHYFNKTTGRKLISFIKVTSRRKQYVASITIIRHNNKCDV